MNTLNDIVKYIDSSTKTLFILCGFPYAGKSFIAELLIRKRNVVYVSIDDIFYRHGFDWSTDRLPSKDEWQRIFDESYRLTREALMQGRNVLYDSTNQTRDSRDKLREVASSVGARAKVLFIRAEEATIWRRWEETAAKKNRPVVRRELVQMTIESFEVPEEDEDVLIVENEA